MNVSSVGNIRWKGAFRCADSVTEAQALAAERHVSSVTAAGMLVLTRVVKRRPPFEEKHALIDFQLFRS